MEEWNIVLNTLNGNKIVPSKNNPDKPGDYLCTCIIKSEEYEHRYLKVVSYNADRKYWHDVGNPHGISHIVLAWKEQQVCDFDDFDYETGMLFEKGVLE